MSDSSKNWQEQFTQLFHEGVEKFKSGRPQAIDFIHKDCATFLASIGYTEQEFLDFVEDFAVGGQPTLATALDIAAVRRDYFLNEQAGKRSSHEISMADLPSKDAEVEGIGWLPRLIPKAEAKLRGEMPADLMYGCGGDRKFFRTNTLDAAEFLRQVWKAGGDKAKIVSWVKTNRKAAA